MENHTWQSSHFESCDLEGWFSIHKGTLGLFSMVFHTIKLMYGFPSWWDCMGFHTFGWFSIFGKCMTRMFETACTTHSVCSLDKIRIMILTLSRAQTLREECSQVMEICHLEIPALSLRPFLFITWFTGPWPPTLKNPISENKNIWNLCSIFSLRPYA